MIMTNDMLDKFHEECAIFGVWNQPEASNLAYLGLYSLQHRGQEGAGVTAYDLGTKRLSSHRGLGLVNDVFHNFDFQKLPGTNAIGHARYSTAGENRLANVQPFQAEVSSGRIAIGHNGNLINASELKAELIEQGAIFSSTSDTEVILHLIARNAKNGSVAKAISDALSQVRGAYSLVILAEDRLFAVRDPHGIRPLALARLNQGYVVASETCAFDLLGAEYIRDIEPGEILEIHGKGELKSHKPWPKVESRPCIFEYVYFARPDSNVFGKNVYKIRKEMGRELAREAPVKADLIVPVPDSGVTAALGFAEESKIPFDMGLIRNHYVGRTFIEPQQSIRDFGVKIKHNANPDILAGKSVIVVDDSIVRGTTTKKLVKMLRAAGAKEVHIRISSPPTTDPCYYGIDTPEKEQLIASHQSVSQIKEFVGAESLAYLSLEGLYRAVNSAKGSFCDACFSGRYAAGKPEPSKAKKCACG